MTPRRRLISRTLGALAAAALATATLTPPATATAADAPPPPVPRVEPGDLATSPYMGWSSFSTQVFTGENTIIDADGLVAQSDAMHEKLQDHGYDRINIDAGWNDGFDDYGRPVPSKTHYPDGFQDVVDHVHGNGQKIGLYFIPGIGPEVYEADLPVWNAPGCTTHDIVKQPLQQADYWDIGYALDFSNPCATAWVDSVGALLGEWGVDFVKFDSVTPGSGIEDGSMDARDDVAAWSKALHDHGIWFELSWALDVDHADYWREHADGWRVDWDVECYCENDRATTWENVARLFPKAEEWWRLTGPGGFGDFDSLNVGNGLTDGLTRPERRTAMTLWAMQASPLYAGNDLTDLDEFGLGLLTNDEIIAINQAAIPAHPVVQDGNQQVWASLQDDGSYAVALYNVGSTEKNLTLDWADLGLSDGKHRVRDVWAQKNLGSFDGQFTAASVPPHGVRVIRVSPGKSSTSVLNDDVMQIGYGGDWHRNGGDETVATSQDLAVSVVEPDGDTTPPSDTTTRVTTVNDDDPLITLDGTWSHSTDRGMGDHEDDVAWTEQDGDAFETTFRGTGVQYLTERDVSQGEADVYLDGKLVTSIDASLPEGTPRESQQVLYEVSGLDDGPHTLRVVKTSGKFLLLDAIRVEQTNLLVPNAVVVPEGRSSDVAVRLERSTGELASVARDGEALQKGVDYTVGEGAVVLSGSYLSALPVGDQTIGFAFRGDLDDDVRTGTGDAWTDLTFTGTAVSWAAPTAPDQGTVDVFLDGRLVETVDTRTDTRRTRQELVTFDGLKRGEHRIVVQNASGDVIRSDGFSFTR